MPQSSFRFPHQSFSPPPHLPHAPIISSFLYHPNSVWCWWEVKIMKLLIMQFSQFSCHFLPSYFHVSSSAFYSAVCSSLKWEWPSFTPILNRQNYSSVCFNLYIPRQHQRIQNNGAKDSQHSFHLICFVTGDPKYVNSGTFSKDLVYPATCYTIILISHEHIHFSVTPSKPTSWLLTVQIEWSP